MQRPKLINVTEEIVHGLVKFLLFGSEYQTFCHCENCEMDITANVLNELPTNYVSTVSARDLVFQKLNNPAFIELVNKEIIRTIHSIGKKPGHL